MIYINNLPLTNYKDVQIVEEVSGGFMLSFTSFDYQNNAHKELKEEAVVTIDDYDFRIKQINESTYTKQISAVSTFFDLGGIYKSEIYGGTRTIKQFLTWTLSGTGWTYEYIGTDPYILIPNYGTDNALKLIQGLCEVAKIEYKIMPNNHLIFKEKIGSNNNAQYRYGHNIKALEKTVDTTNLKTKVEGIGHEGLSVIYTSPYAKQFGIIEAEPIIQEEFTNEKELLNHIKSQINDEPLLSIKLDAIELIDKELGEEVWLIYEPLEIELQSRVLKVIKTIKRGQLVVDSVVIGNHKPKTSTDLLAKQKVEIDKNKKITMSYIEQTNDRIRLAVEEINGEMAEQKAEFELTASQIRSEVKAVDKRLGDRITTTNSRITQTASEIRSEVNKEVKYLDGRIDSTNSKITQTASEIRSEVNSKVDTLDGKINKNSSSITQTADQIRTEVNTEIKRVDGDITTANSKIEQTAKEIRSEVAYDLGKVDEQFEGVTSAISKVEQQADKIESTVSTVEQEVDDLDSKVRRHSSSISQMSNEISMKVSAGDIASEINQTAQGVKIRADKIQMDGIVELSESVELGRSSNSHTKAIKFDGTGAWIYSNGSNLTISSNYLEIDAYTDALSPISSRRGGLVLAPDGLWVGIQSDGRLRVSDGSQVRYYAPM